MWRMTMGLAMAAALFLSSGRVYAISPSLVLGAENSTLQVHVFTDVVGTTGTHHDQTSQSSSYSPPSLGLTEQDNATSGNGSALGTASGSTASQSLLDGFRTSGVLSAGENETQPTSGSLLDVSTQANSAQAQDFTVSQPSKIVLDYSVDITTPANHNTATNFTMELLQNPQQPGGPTFLTPAISLNGQKPTSSGQFEYELTPGNAYSFDYAANAYSYANASSNVSFKVALYDPAVVPLPTSLALGTAGLLMLAWGGRRLLQA